MGLMDQFKKGGNLGAGDMGEMMELQKKYARLNEVGVERRATITSLKETGRKDFGGSPEYEFVLQIQGDGGAYEATILQFMLPDQLKLFPQGKEIAVKVDPDDPNSAIIWG